MTLWSISAIAVALAMDAFAVSITTGIVLGSLNIRHYFRLSWHFGLFQAMMPVIGWFAGLSIRRWIESYDHWIAFGLLFYVAQGMLRSAWAGDGKDRHRNDPTKGATLVLLSVATSIDALAVGLSLSLLNISIWFPAAVIGITAGLFTITGMKLGQRIGHTAHLGRWAEAVGGCVLLLIGLNILRDHGVISL